MLILFYLKSSDRTGRPSRTGHPRACAEERGRRVAGPELVLKGWHTPTDGSGLWTVFHRCESVVHAPQTVRWI